jgi:hypothetical protein
MGGASGRLSESQGVTGSPAISPRGATPVPGCAVAEMLAIPADASFGPVHAPGGATKTLARPRSYTALPPLPVCVIFSDRSVWQLHSTKFPEIYFQSMIKLAMIHRIELGQPQAFQQPRTREEVLHKMEERTGLAGRKMLEKFLVRLDKLERGRSSR